MNNIEELKKQLIEQFYNPNGKLYYTNDQLNEIKKELLSIVDIINDK